MYPLKFTVLKSAEPDLQDTWTKIRDLNYFRNEARHTKAKLLPASTKSTTQSSITAAKRSFNSKGTLVSAAWDRKESKRLEIERKSEHKRMHTKSMAEQKEQNREPRTSTPGVEPSGRRSRGETTPPTRREEEGNEDGIDLGTGEERNGEDMRLKGEWEG